MGQSLGATALLAAVAIWATGSGCSRGPTTVVRSKQIAAQVQPLPGSHPVSLFEGAPPVCSFEIVGNVIAEGPEAWGRAVDRARQMGGDALILTGARGDDVARTADVPASREEFEAWLDAYLEPTETEVDERRLFGLIRVRTEDEEPELRPVGHVPPSTGRDVRRALPGPATEKVSALIIRFVDPECTH